MDREQGPELVIPLGTRKDPFGIEAYLKRAYPGLLDQATSYRLVRTADHGAPHIEIELMVDHRYLSEEPANG